HTALHSFPTRRSSDLEAPRPDGAVRQDCQGKRIAFHAAGRNGNGRRQVCRDGIAGRAEWKGRGIRGHASVFEKRQEIVRPARERSEEHTSELQSLAYL